MEIYQYVYATQLVLNSQISSELKFNKYIHKV